MVSAGGVHPLRTPFFWIIPSPSERLPLNFILPLLKRKKGSLGIGGEATTANPKEPEKVACIRTKIRVDLRGSFLPGREPAISVLRTKMNMWTPFSGLEKRTRCSARMSLWKLLSWLLLVKTLRFTPKTISSAPINETMVQGYF